MLKASASIALCFLLGACSPASLQEVAVPHQAPEPLSLPEEQLVDRFEHRGHTVEVYFIDPLAQLIARDPNFVSKTPEEQAQEYISYLYSNRIYRFSVSTDAGLPVGDLVLEGDPSAEGTALIYKLIEYRPVESGTERVSEMPQRGRWEAFEHMRAFQTERGQQAIGRGVAIFPGIFTRVAPYAEIKAALLPSIDALID